MLDRFLRKFLTAERRERSNAHQRPLQAAHICANAAGEELENLIPQFDLHAVRLFSQDGQPRLDVWRLKFSGKSPFKTRNQTLLQVRDFRGGPITGQYDLFVAVKKCIECVKEFFL